MEYLYDACDQISDYHIFLSNYWWQKSDIWSQALYRYPISWEAFLDPSDSYFLFADCWFYTYWTYMHIFRHIFLSNYWWQKSDIWSQASYRYPILTGPKRLPTIWHTYIKLVTKYQIPVINSCLEKCNEKCAYMFNMYFTRSTGTSHYINIYFPRSTGTSHCINIYFTRSTGTSHCCWSC
jgi:hypothetical protein